MTDSNNSGFANNEPVDMTDSGMSDNERRQREAEIYDRLLDGRSYAESVILDAEYGEIECDIDLSPIDRKRRWDVMKTLPDGMFKAAEEAEEGEEPEVEASSDTVPDGEGMQMLEGVVKDALTAKGLSDGQLNSVIENDLGDQVVMELGMSLMNMSFEQGQITGFRFK